MLWTETAPDKERTRVRDRQTETERQIETARQIEIETEERLPSGARREVDALDVVP